MDASTSDKALVPVWDGRHETWHHFLVEVKWTLSSMKPSERPLLAARLIRKNLQSGPAPLVQLLYKLDPDDFRNEEDVARLIRFLEDSPLNKQPLPEAGNRIGAYYRRLHRKPHESVRQYIVREEKIHDDMLKALQRLLRERELDFEQYECTIDELKEFVGMKDGASVYFEDAASAGHSVSEPGGNPFDADISSVRDSDRDLDGERESTSRTERISGHESQTPKVKAGKGKDLLQRLMEKGLMPLSALDVIRGWLLLETCIPGDENGKRMVKAATRNKLTYQEIRSALMNMYEDNLGGSRAYRGHNYVMEGDYGWEESTEGHQEADEIYYQGHEEWPNDSWQSGECSETAWNQTEWDEGIWPEENEDQGTEVNTEELQALMQAQDEAEQAHRDLQLMMAETNRNLSDARKAVAAATKDRGWGAGPQQKGRMTSTYPNKGKGKFKGKNQQEAHWFQGKGQRFGPTNKGYRHPGFGKKGAPPFSKSFNHKGGKGGSQYVLDADYELLTLDVENDVMHSEQPPSSQTKSEKEQLFPCEAIIDTGATASAGGHQAVTQLCAAISRARPSTQISVFQSDRPWFRYGSGTWGQALFRVRIQVPPKEISIFALPSEGVPVLIGMRELMALDVLIACKSAKGLVAGECVTFRRTKKLHNILDFLQHVFPSSPQGIVHAPSSSTTSTPSSILSQGKDRRRERNVRFHDMDTKNTSQELHVLELSYDVDEEEIDEEWDHAFFFQSNEEDQNKQNHSEHLGITAEQWQHLSGQSISVDFCETKEAIMSDLKDMVKSAVKEAMEKEKSSGESSKGKTKNKGKITYDSTRRQGVDLRDPRAQVTQWPCFGKHQETRSGNRFGHWAECQKCGLRLMYEPEITAPGESTKTNLPQNVTEALEKMRSSGWTAEEITSRQIKSMIEITAREKALIKNPKKGVVKVSQGYIKDTKNIAETKNVPILENDAGTNRQTKKGKSETPEIQQIGSEDEASLCSFEAVENLEEKSKGRKERPQEAE